VSTPAQLRGYLLEEALAWLLRNSGYRLLVDQTHRRRRSHGCVFGYFRHVLEVVTKVMSVVSKALSVAIA
jgi:hypothetical protein